MSQLFKAIHITKYGQPLKVLNLITGEINTNLSGKQVLLKHLASPINPADISMIYGAYGYKPPLPTAAGLEGSARVMATGPNAQHLRLDDVVVFIGSSGAWQTHSIAEEDNLLKVDKTLDPMTSCQIKVNPCTAYRMLKDFVPMRPGDSFIQSGANSAVGVYAIQMAKIWGLKSINVIRDRTNLSEVVDELKSFGADCVVTESQLKNRELMDSIFNDIPRPRLFLDCVYGPTHVDCHRHVADSALCVVYGGMSRKVLPAGAYSSLGDYIFENHSLTVKGFWMTRWYNEKLKTDRKAVDEMIDEICSLFKQGQLKTKSYQPIRLDDYKDAIESLAVGFNNKKYIFDMSLSDK